MPLSTKNPDIQIEYFSVQVLNFGFEIQDNKSFFPFEYNLWKDVNELSFFSYNV